jgi:protein-disulfide isomerase
LEPGTAKDVARKAAVDIDWEKVHALIDGDGPKDAAQQEDSCCPTAATRWSPALDELLRPCESKAREAGIMMTPVLVVGGRCVHQGSVPDRNRVTQWIKAVFGGAPEGDRFEHVVEVLGPGCAKCDQLYRNVLEAVNRADLQDRVAVKKRTDIGYFLEMGVAVTPGLVINGTVVSKGKVLRPEQIADLLRSNLR